MGIPKILVLIGGIGQNSLNKKLFNAIRDVSQNDVEFIIADIAHFPFFSQDLENDPPDIIIKYKDQIRQADGVLFVTPEYNRSMPGVLKNAIDWGSRPYGHNLWERMPAGIVGASSGNIGTFGAQNHLRQTLAYLNMLPMAAPEFYFKATPDIFDEQGRVTNPKTKQFISNFWEAYKEWVGKFNVKAQTMIPPYMSQGLEDNPGIQ